MLKMRRCDCSAKRIKRDFRDYLVTHCYLPSGIKYTHKFNFYRPEKNEAYKNGTFMKSYGPTL